MLEIPAAVMAWCYSVVGSYAVAIAMLALAIAALTTPLTVGYANAILKRRNLVPEMRALQQTHRDDRERLIREMQALYERSTPSRSSWIVPLVVQAAVFVVVFRLLEGLVYRPVGAAEPVAARVWLAFEQPFQAADPGFVPRHVPVDSELYRSLFGQYEMASFTLDLSRSAMESLADGLVTGLPYILLVVALGFLYSAQRRIVTVEDVLPGLRGPVRWWPIIVVAVQSFFIAAVVVYYLWQTASRLGQLFIAARRHPPPSVE